MKSMLSETSWSLITWKLIRLLHNFFWKVIWPFSPTGLLFPEVCQYAEQFFQRTHNPVMWSHCLLTSSARHTEPYGRSWRALFSVIGSMGGGSLWREVLHRSKFGALQTLHTGRSLLSVVSVTEETSLSTLLVRNIAHCREEVLTIKLPI